MFTLYDTPAALIASVFFILMLVAVEVGQALGRRVDSAAWATSSGAYSTVTGAVLGLLGLLLAFSFGMADTRYNARKAVVLKEANVIGTAYLRTSFLRPPVEAQAKNLIRDYVDAVVAYNGSGTDRALESQSLQRALVLQNQMWALSNPADGYLEPQAIRLSLLSASINELIDVSSERKAARDNRVPDEVLLLLFVVGVLSATMGGFAFGATRHRNWIVTLSFTVLVTMVVFTILDLDRPRRGLIQVDQAPMLDLRASLRP